jgi:hypothetical protein
MIKDLKRIIENNNITDIYLTGFVDTEDGVVEFFSDARFIYFEFANEFIEFESVNQFSRLRIKIVQSVRHEFEIDEDMKPGKASIGVVILTDIMAIDNKVKSICFYNLQESENELNCDALYLKLLNGQEIFLDPTFYFGINIGGNEQKKFWIENLPDGVIPIETCIELD